MEEFASCFSDPLHIEMSLFSEWLDGTSMLALGKIALEMWKNYDVPYGIIQQEVQEQFNLFGYLELYLKSPQLLYSPLFSSLTSLRKENLLEQYYNFDKVVMREILGKRMNSKLRKDMEDVSERTKVNLKSCLRQFDNVKNILKACEDTEGSILEVLKEQFCFSELLVKQYYPLIFVFLSRFETTKKKQQFLSYDDIIKCAEHILQRWTVQESCEKHSNDGEEIDRTFVHELREIRHFINDKENLDNYRTCVLARLEKKATTLHFIKNVDFNFRNITRNIFSLGGGLSHTKEFRDFFLDYVEKIIEPIKQLEWVSKEVEVFFDVLIDAWPDVCTESHVKVPADYLQVFTRFMKVMRECLKQLYS